MEAFAGPHSDRQGHATDTPARRARPKQLPNSLSRSCPSPRQAPKSPDCSIGDRRGPHLGGNGAHERLGARRAGPATIETAPQRDADNMPKPPPPPEFNEYLAQPDPSVIATLDADGGPHTAAGNCQMLWIGQ